MNYYYDNLSTEAQSLSDDYDQENIKLSFLTKYKTQPCKNYSLTGYCTYGDKCQFAHGTFELMPMNCNYLYKTKKCKNFWKKGYCLYGIRCQFLHSQGHVRKIKTQKFNYQTLETGTLLSFNEKSKLLGVILREGQIIM